MPCSPDFGLEIPRQNLFYLVSLFHFFSVPDGIFSYVFPVSWPLFYCICVFFRLGKKKNRFRSFCNPQLLCCLFIHLFLFLSTLPSSVSPSRAWPDTHLSPHPQGAGRDGFRSMNRQSKSYRNLGTTEPTLPTGHTKEGKQGRLRP